MAYKTVITNNGATKLNEKLLASQKLNLTTFSVGVGKAAESEDLKTRIELVDKKYTAAVSDIIPSADHVAIKCVIPPDVESITEDLTIKELGIYDENGVLCVYAVVPDTLRPVSNSGAGTETVITALVKFQGRDISVNVDPDSTATKSDFRELVQRYQVPVGAIVPFKSATAPSGWLLCNGITVDKSVYPELVEHLTGDSNAASAKLPDLRGEFIRGWSDSRGVDAGRVLGSSQTDSLKSHRHKNGIGDEATIANAMVYGQTSEDVISVPDSMSTGAANSTYQGFTSYDGDGETRPRNVALAYYIKAYGEVVSQGSVDISNALTQISQLSSKVDESYKTLVIDKEFNDLTPVSEMTELGVYPIQYYAYDSNNEKSFFPDSYHVVGRSTFNFPALYKSIKPWMKFVVTPERDGTLLTDIYFPSRMGGIYVWGYIISKRVNGVTTIIRNSMLINEPGNCSFGIKNNIEFSDSVTKGGTVEYLVTFFVAENNMPRDADVHSGINCAEYDVGVYVGWNDESTRFTLNDLDYADTARTYEGDPGHPLSLFNQVESRHGKCKIQAFII